LGNIGKYLLLPGITHQRYNLILHSPA